LNATGRRWTFWIAAAYLAAAIIMCIGLGTLAARITAAHLQIQAQSQLSRLQANQPIWTWRFRRSRDLIAGHAFGSATVAANDDALIVTSTNGTPFELGVPIAWSLDLAHWPVLQLELKSSDRAQLGLVVTDTSGVPCLAMGAGTLTPDTSSLRLDLRGLVWKTASGTSCSAPGVVQMLRLRIDAPEHATMHLASASLLTTEPIQPSPHDIINLPDEVTGTGVARFADGAKNMAVPLFHLPDGINAETMLSLRDQLRLRWPAALIVATDTSLQAITPTSHTSIWWAACVLYLVALLWLTYRPFQGKKRAWLEIVGCLLGPLWLIAGLHWGLSPTPLGFMAFGAGLLFAFVIERRHLPRLWRWPSSRRDWLWPFAPLLVTVLLSILYGHALSAQPLGHVFAYFGWAWVQQWLMLIVIMRRFELVLYRPGWAVIATALVFALLHTPNGMLMQLCFVGELWWAWCFLRSRSVLPIALAHAACALLIESGLVGGLVRSLEVSGRFFL
jgi:hypothetical protein